MRDFVTGFRWWEDMAHQSMLVEDGCVIAREPGLKGSPGDKVVDCKGQILMPAFIDSHCHVLPMGLDLKKLHLSGCSSREEVLDRVRSRLPDVAPHDWLHGVHYDQTRFADGVHLSRWELDSVSSNVPILLRHVNGHASVANSRALAAAGITPDTPDPGGGAFVRNADGELTGVLLERAHEQVTSASPSPTTEQMVEAILAASERMAGWNIACASDMMTGRWNLEQELTAYTLASERGCKVRLRLYLQWATVFGPRAATPERLAELTAAMNPNRCRVAGVKIFADGAIGSATAAIYGRFTSSPDDGRTEDGQLIYDPTRLASMVRIASDAGYQIAVHSIGDRSTDLVMNCYEALPDARRHRIEHAMMLSDAQVSRMARLGCRCTMQPEFLMRFGHAYVRQLGIERAASLKRARSVLNAGLRLSFSSDLPITTGDPWDGIRTAVHRPDGFDPAEAVSPAEAIRAYTVNGAEANEDMGVMGALLPGEFADYQLVSDAAFASLRRS